MLGKPVITGTRIPVEQILRKLAADMSVDAIPRDYPRLTREDIHAALAYESESGGAASPDRHPSAASWMFRSNPCSVSPWDSGDTSLNH
jgi:uncharacterized protein (DUF433 family)